MHAQHPRTPSRRKLRWIAAAASLSLLAWVALAAGIALEAGTGTMFVLASAAAVTTEGTIWLAAALLGLSAFQVRRNLWDSVRHRFSRALRGGARGQSMLEDARTPEPLKRAPGHGDDGATR